jgi:hypothetical protein
LKSAQESSPVAHDQAALAAKSDGGRILALFLRRRLAVLDLAGGNIDD